MVSAEGSRYSALQLPDLYEDLLEGIMEESGVTEDMLEEYGITEDMLYDLEGL